MVLTIFSGINFPSLCWLAKKLKHLTEDPPTMGTSAYDDWVASDCSMMTWLLSSMDEKVSASVIFLKTTKEIWEI